MAGIEPKNSGWRVVWRFDGRKQYTVTWPTREIAEQAAKIAEAFGHRITGPEVDKHILGEDPRSDGVSTITLRDWCETWLAAKTRITPGTRRRYHRQLKLRILPILGDIPVHLVTASDIGKFINSLRESNLKNSTLTRYYAVLHGAFEGAIREGLREDNPCALSDFVRDQVADDDEGDENRVYLTPEEYEIFLEAFPSDARLLVELLAGTGARWSEATALAVKHLVAPTKKKGPRIKIWRAWKQDDNGKWYLGSTKGRQKRSIGISDELYEKLIRATSDRSGDDFLVTAPAGGHVIYANFYNRRWVPSAIAAQRCGTHPPANQEEARDGAQGICSDYGGVRSNGKPCGARVLPGSTRCRSHRGPAPEAVSSCDCPDVLHVQPTPHDLRHSHAAWLFADPDVAPLAISRRLGHANLSTTSEIYGGLIPDAEEAAVAAISAVTTTKKKKKSKSGKKKTGKSSQRPEASPGEDFLAAA